MIRPVYPKPRLLNEDGLIAAYNMVPENGTLRDISGNGNTLDITSALSTKEGMAFDGVKDFASSSSNIAFSGNQLTIDCSFIMRIDPPGGSAAVIFESSTDFNAAIGSFVLFIDSAMRVNFGFKNSGYIAYFVDTALKLDVINTVSVRTDVTVAGTDVMDFYINGVKASKIVSSDGGSRSQSFLAWPLYIGGRGGTSLFAGAEILDSRFHLDFRSEKQIKDYHNQFANQVSLKEDFRNAPLEITQTPKGWQKGTGSFKVVKDGDRNVLECASNGTISTQSKQAYGTWEFEFYFGTGQTVAQIINSTKDLWVTGLNDCYSLVRVGGAEDLRFYRNTSLILRTATGYVEENESYKFKITRSTSGEFTLYIKGGSFGNNYVLIDPTGGLGTNPIVDNTHKTSNYFVNDMDTGDQISNIVIKKGIEQ